MKPSVIWITAMVALLFSHLELNTMLQICPMNHDAWAPNTRYSILQKTNHNTKNWYLEKIIESTSLPRKIKYVESPGNNKSTTFLKFSICDSWMYTGDISSLLWHIDRSQILLRIFPKYYSLWLKNMSLVQRCVVYFNRIANGPNWFTPIFIKSPCHMASMSYQLILFPTK